MRLKPYGPRGWAMLSLAFLSLARAASYFEPHGPAFIPTGIILLAPLVPPCIWGALWGATGLALLVTAFRQRQALALAMLAGMSAIWSIVYLVTAIIRTAMDGFTSAWMSALVYFAFFGLVVAIARMINPVGIRGADE